MSVAFQVDRLSLHLPPTRKCDVNAADGDYDFAWYEVNEIAFAWLGHHIVALYDARTDTLEVGPEFAQQFKQWARARAKGELEAGYGITELGLHVLNDLEAQRGNDGTVDPL